MEETSFCLRFWGVRGTAPTPDRSKLRYGGNTICASTSLGPNEHLILDCGTGIMRLGRMLASTGAMSGHRFHVFLSHYHFDHIAGLSLFQPLYDAAASFTFYGFDARGRGVKDILEGLIAPPYFPVTLAGVPARTRHVSITGEGFELGNVRVDSMPLYHPDGCLAFRLERNGRRIVYATDHEHGDPATDAALVGFSESADYLIYDATYLPPEYESLRKGWGHSTWYAAVQAARAARVRKLVLFHHHPDHTDDDLDAIERLAREEFPDTVTAREGMELAL
jgi:phosphoribosyl 1,2-cyclic phosphodiesterase